MKQRYSFAPATGPRAGGFVITDWDISPSGREFYRPDYSRSETAATVEWLNARDIMLRSARYQPRRHR